MTRDDVIRSIGELADLMRAFEGDRDELLNLTWRMQVRLDQLKGHLIAGRPDLAARLREPIDRSSAETTEQVALEEFLR